MRLSQLLVAALTLTLLQPAAAMLTAEQLRSIAKEATIYGFPLVDNYRVQYSYFVDRKSPEFKAPWNQIHNDSRVFTPNDKAIQTPNSDTPYSQLGADLRAEPLVLGVPAVEDDRYYSLQFIDLYTFNFAYVGSRATGNDAKKVLLAGPHWDGPTPDGIAQVIRSETEFAFVLYRTQLKNPDDMDKVRAIQAGYTVEPLSSYLNQAPPKAPAAINFPKPPSAEALRTDLEFFNILNFVLQFAPTHPTEKELRARFAKAGIGPGLSFAHQRFNPHSRQAFSQGMQDAWQELARFKTEQVDTGKRTAAESFGTRAFLNNDYLARMSSAAFGIYGNSKEEALYPNYFVDSQGQALNGKGNRYRLRFAKDQLPPVNAFWSLTMYELPSSLLVANALNRYLINSAMLDDLVKDDDGSITLYLQHEPPADALKANWLPAPNGPFWTTLRLYWPKEEALNGQWQQPPLVKAPSRETP